jgi:hypothetical protein
MIIDVPPEICPHCGTSYKPMMQKFEGKMKHKYREGEKVLCMNNRNNSKWHGKWGLIVECMPFTFRYPAYRVSLDGEVVALSEISIRRPR